MHYFDAYRFLFNSPKWLQNLLLGVVCILVPVVGPIVLIGYLFDVIEALHRDRHRTYPDFDFNRIVPYLTRGVWPFLVHLVLILPVILVLLVAFFAAFIMLAGSGSPSPLAVFLIVFLAVAATVVVLGLFALLVGPMWLRAGLSQDFMAAFSLTFLRDFLERVWLELLLSQLFLMGTGFVVVLAGYALFCIGIYPAQVLSTFAGYHLWYQLYELYLERGGTPIPLKAEGYLSQGLGQSGPDFQSGLPRPD